MTSVAVEFSVKTVWSGKGSTDEIAEEVADLFKEYLTGREAPFRCDYGPGAWGGYEGPFVRSVKVTRLKTSDTEPGCL